MSKTKSQAIALSRPSFISYALIDTIKAVYQNDLV